VLLTNLFQLFTRVTLLYDSINNKHQKFIPGLRGVHEHFSVVDIQDLEFSRDDEEALNVPVLIVAVFYSAPELNEMIIISYGYFLNMCVQLTSLSN
jgi:hypothetical protein